MRRVIGSDGVEDTLIDENFGGYILGRQFGEVADGGANEKAFEFFQAAVCNVDNLNICTVAEYR